MPDAIHKSALSLVRQFFIVGGMPEAVGAFAQSGSFQEADAVKQSILSTYRDDFSKYGHRVHHRRIEKVFSKIPVEVKAGKSGSLKSLHVFLSERKTDFALRFNSDRPSYLAARTSLPDQEPRPFHLLSLPFYLVGQTERLCRQSLQLSTA